MFFIVLFLNNILHYLQSALNVSNEKFCYAENVNKFKQFLYELV